MSKSEKVDFLVIGAGPSGSVAAAIAKQQGFSVRVLEKGQFPRFVIGESLLPKCMEHLEAAGFIEVIKQCGFQKKTGAKFVRDMQSCEFDFSDQFTEGWTWTWQVQRSEFDHALVKELVRQGVDVQFNTEVTGVEIEENSSIIHCLRNGKSESVRARFIIDASGYGRVLPKLFNLEKPSASSQRTALFAHLKGIDLPLGFSKEQITIIVHQKDVWIWIIPFSNGIISVGVVGSPDYIQHIPGSENKRLLEILNEHSSLNGPIYEENIERNAKGITSYAVSSKKLHGQNFAITGNSSEFLDPIFSSGVTFATHSAMLAAQLAGKQLKGETVDWDQEFEAVLRSGVSTFKTYIDSWYDGSLQDIFFFENTDDQKFNQTMKKQICSVLAGHVWDLKNPFVKKHAKAINSLSHVVNM